MVSGNSFVVQYRKFLLTSTFISKAHKFSLSLKIFPGVISDKKKIYSGHFTRGSASVEAMVEGKLIALTIFLGKHYFTQTSH